jgi:protein-tyrosine phosphatase
MRGALFLCGKHAVAPDVEAVIAATGATTVVCLTERHELSDRYPGYVAWLEDNRGERALWFPIPDLHAPAVNDVVMMVAEVRARLESAGTVLVHCAAGIGRAGTLATCLLIMMGMNIDEALTHVAAHRPMAGPEVGAQRALVDAVAAWAR